MALNLASPGIVVKEVDLTVGRVTPTSNKIGAIVAPFAKGPIDVPTLVENENDLLNIFGEPYATDKHYESWLTASSYLSYGGSLQVIRSNDTDLKNGFAGAASSIKIKSLDDYNALGYDEDTINNVTVVARNPGSWSNGIQVALIDARADQIIGINTSNIQVGYGITQSLSGKVDIGAGTTSSLDGYYLKGIVTNIPSTGKIEVKVLSKVSTAGTVTAVDYQPSGTWAFDGSSSVVVYNNSGVGVTTTSQTSQVDWFDQQTITISNGISTISSISWNNIANRPSTTAYSADRGGRFDELHIVVIDSLGTITGNAGTILEKHLGLSKASDAEFSAGSPSYWRKYLTTNSAYIFGGSAPVGIITTGFIGNTYTLASDVGWDQEANGIIFAGTGSNTLALAGGLDYNGSAGLNTAGALTSTLSNLSSGYQLFANTEQYKVDFLLMGSAAYAKETAQALANQLIAVAEERKDAIAFISPYRGALLNDASNGTVSTNSSETITSNVISFYAPITSSSYAVFDSGYKYTYDRFSNTFRYIPLNGDIAGTCARNDINNFAWYSPAGTSRGAILNAVKLAYNPSKSQRDRLYSNRINPIIFSPGSGIVLFGDKTALGKSSAFDRINVRRLFLYLEQAISTAAKDQLFEFNDEITRTNFVNIVEPFLRDVQAKRGIYDYVVICDETNNTAAVIDNNEFLADIYIKPARSINYIGLTFIATRTGVSFEEVIGKF